MASYELTIILPGDTGAAKVKTFTQTLGKNVTTAKGRVVKSDEWGKIALTYPIKKNETGFFLHFELELEGAEVKNLTNRFKLDDDIIRYLLVKK